ncbi:hypothetical protein GXW82_05020 [Streptacidiphilus sp. 4-A2]|nr:hypothetical protein [Streptacidiphilus sp. 4-A2]
MGTLRRDEGGIARLLTSLTELQVLGGQLDWEAVFAGTGARRCPLPTYAFQQQSYWLRPGPERMAQPEPGGTGGADRDFWEIVRREDAEALADILKVDDEELRGSLTTLVPALSGWLHGRQGRDTVDGWRYKVDWRALSPGGTPRLGGRWLVVLPPGPRPTRWSRAACGRCGRTARIRCRCGRAARTAARSPTGCGRP